MRDPRLLPFRGPLAAFALMLALQAASAAVLFLRKFGLAAAGIQAYYLGSEAGFAPPRSLQGLLEVAVPHLLAIPVTLFVTIHLVGFAGLLGRRPFAVLGAATFGSALAVALGGLAVRFLWPGLAPLKVAAFLGLEGALLLWLGLLVALFRRPGRAAGALGSETAQPVPEIEARRQALRVASPAGLAAASAVRESGCATRPGPPAAAR